MPGSNSSPDGRNRTDLQLAQHLFHLLDDQLDAGAHLLALCRGLECQLEVVEHGKKLLDDAAGGIVAIFSLLALGAFAGVLKLGLQAGQAVNQLVALCLHLVVFGAAYRLGLGGGRFAASVPLTGRYLFLRPVGRVLHPPIPSRSIQFPVLAYLYVFSEKSICAYFHFIGFAATAHCGR